MSWLAGQLGKSFAPYVVVALLVAIAGLSITTRVLWSNNTELQKSLAVSEASVTSLTKVDEINQETIRTYQEANKQWSELFEVHQRNNTEGIERLFKLNAELEKEAQRLISGIRDERKEPNCEALLSLDIQSVCPAHAQRMRIDASRNSD